MTDSFHLHAYAAAKRRKRQRSRSGPVIVVTVHREVWETALQAANGDVRRIRIISSTEVIVANHGRKS